MIKQAKLSNIIQFFRNGFYERWNLHPYLNMDESCIFVGVYTEEDVHAINSHRGFKLIYHTGRLRKCFYKISPHNTVICIPYFFDFDLPDEYRVKNGIIAIKDFSTFKPSVLGDSIYCYIGSESMKELMGYELASWVSKNTKYKVIYGKQGNSIDYVVSNFYDKCFVNLKPNFTGGYTTAIELAFMGRQTISNGKGEFCINYSNKEDIIDIVNQESKKIGSIVKGIIPDNYFLGDVWKDENYWL